MIDFTPTHIKDLVWYDGPIVSTYGFDEKIYLTLWVDVEANLSRWVVAETTQQEVDQLEAKEITVRAVLMTSPALFTLDVTDGPAPAVTHALVPVKWEDLPEDYRPTERSYL